MRLPNFISPYKLAFILPKGGESDLLWNFSWNVLEELEKVFYLIKKKYKNFKKLKVFFDKNNFLIFL